MSIQNFDMSLLAKFMPPPFLFVRQATVLLLTHTHTKKHLWSSYLKIDSYTRFVVGNQFYSLASF